TSPAPPRPPRAISSRSTSGVASTSARCVPATSPRRSRRCATSCPRAGCGRRPHEVGRVTADWPLALADLLLVVVVARCGGWIAVRCAQPRIAGEMLAVVALGPTVLGGRVEGAAGAAAAGTVGVLFPAAAVDLLSWAGALGLILYMLLVGMA